MSSFFESLVTAAHRAGEVARNATAAAKQAWESVEPGVTAALNKARALSDPQARAEAMAQLDAIIERAKKQGNVALGDLQTAVNSIREAAKGVPPQVAMKLATFASLQEVAAAKGALELAEMQVCVKAVETLRAAIAADPSGDHTKAANELDGLIVAASTAVDQLSADENTVRGQLADANTLLSDIRTTNAKVVAAQDTYVKKVAGVTAADVDISAQIEPYVATLAAAQSLADAGNFVGAAVSIHNWSFGAKALLAERAATRLSFVKKANAPDSVEGLFSTLYSRAERSGLAGSDGDAKLNELAGQVLTAARERPCDVTKAEGLLQRFQERLSQVEAEKAAPSA